MGVYSLMRNTDVFGAQFGYDCLGGLGFGTAGVGLPSICRGTYTATDKNVKNKFQSLYEGIARANLVLQNIDNCSMDEKLRPQYRAEAKFMRALYYFTLTDFFGGVPIYDESTIVEQDFMNMLKGRESIEKVRDFILNDIDFAIDNLPIVWDESNRGRATAGAALALKGKVLLYAKKYDEAKSCFEDLISGKYGDYELYPDYADLFKPGGDESSEMIFAIQNSGGIGKDYGMPTTFYMGSRSAFGSCWNNVMPSVELVDSYEWRDGRPFNWDEVVPGFNNSDEIKNQTFTSILNGNYTEVVKYPDSKGALLEMYAERDPRMDASIILPYTMYKGWFANAPKDMEYVVTKEDGLVNEANGFVRVSGNFKTYLFRKFVAEYDMNGQINDRAHTPINFPLIRLADVYLMLAECYNQSDNPDQNKAVYYINLVRKRPSVNMPLINSGPDYLKATTKEEVFKRIRHERAVELAAEGHSFSDMKRWGLLETLNGPMVGFTNLFYYERVVRSRDYLWPIPYEEIQKNPNLTQNPGW